MFNMVNNTEKIILASASPRRIRMLQQLDIDFEVIESFVDEEAISAGSPEDIVRILSIAKAESVSLRFPDNWVIGADSIVTIDDIILNKPISPAHAKEMLTCLSGRTHRVMTGYSIFRQTVGHRFTDVVISEVTFKTLREEEIDWYTGTREPYDKAGAYAIQGIGAFMISRINGSYTNVVGLPLAEVIDHLAGCNALKHKG
jgi:septum formation protein